MKKIILFNGPPGSGKDTAGLAVLLHFDSIRMERIKFSDPVKEGTHRAYGLNVLIDHFEDSKDKPRAEFYGATPRQAYIAYSEKFMKPLHGKEIFGIITAHKMHQSTAPLIVTPDSGFVEEALPVKQAFRAENILLFRIEREGYDYSNDSRGKVDLGPDVLTIDIENVNGKRAEFQSDIVAQVEAWI